jgi:hypothetical protein
MEGQRRADGCVGRVLHESFLKTIDARRSEGVADDVSTIWLEYHNSGHRAINSFRFWETASQYIDARHSELAYSCMGASIDMILASMHTLTSD